MRRFMFVWLCLILVTAPALANEAPPAPPEHRTNGGRAFAYGILAGTAGFAAGAMIGAGFSDDEHEFDGLAAGFIGGSILGGLFLPLGVHKGNHKQGKLGLVMLTSVLTAGAGWGLAAATNDGAFVVATPLVQLVGCTAVEVATTPSPESPRLAAGPMVMDGQPGLVVAGSF